MFERDSGRHIVDQCAQPIKLFARHIACMYVVYLELRSYGRLKMMICLKNSEVNADLSFMDLKFLSDNTILEMQTSQI